IWSTPSGLQGYGLVNGKGEAIEFADPRVATDNRTYLHDKVVWAGWKCVYCHAQGMIPVEDEVRLSARDTLGFLAADPKEQERIADLYFGEDLNRLLQADQLGYAAAVTAVTGKDPAAAALAFQARHWRYLDEPLVLEDVCLDTGYPAAAVKPVFEEAGRA